jgi:hypothetical protein
LRKPKIAAAAAHVILTPEPPPTDNFFRDDDAPRAEGVRDFDACALAPGVPRRPDPVVR